MLRSGGAEERKPLSVSKTDASLVGQKNTNNNMIKLLTHSNDRIIKAVVLVVLVVVSTINSEFKNLIK